jgi:hypothetical protein
MPAKSEEKVNRRFLIKGRHQDGAQAGRRIGASFTRAKRAPTKKTLASPSPQSKN